MLVIQQHQPEETQLVKMATYLQLKRAEEATRKLM